MKGTPEAEVVTVGETMAVLTSPPGIPLRMARALNLSVAGAESNVAIGLARLGRTSAWWGRVGDDELGRLICTVLRGEGVDVSRVVVDATAPTGVMFKERRADAVARVLYYRRESAGSRLSPSDIPTSLPPGARHLHVSGITSALSDGAREAVNVAIQVARGAHLTVSLDVNYRAALWAPAVAAPELASLARSADIVFATRAEARLVGGPASSSLGGGDDPRAGEGLCQAVATLGPSEVIMKCGAQGAVSLVAGEIFRVPAEATRVVDPVGAGDAFVAGYLAAAMAGEAPLARLKAASRTAAFALGAEGDWEGLPSLRDLGSWEDGGDEVQR